MVGSLMLYTESLRAGSSTCSLYKAFRVILIRRRAENRWSGWLRSRAVEVTCLSSNLSPPLTALRPGQVPSFLCASVSSSVM